MNPLEKLKNLTKKASPENMMLGMLDQFLPKIKSFADNLNRSVAEGGILMEGEGQAALMVDFSAEQPAIYVATFRLQGDDTVLNRAIDIKHLTQKQPTDEDEA